MSAVMISIKPEWCEKIANGEKIIELRKTRPKMKTMFKCYIYCTMDGAGRSPKRYLWKKDKTGQLREIYWNGKVIGEFVCKKVDVIRHVGCTQNDVRLCVVDENLYCHGLDYEYVNNKCCISILDMEEYAKGGRLYGWHLSELVIYDKPKELSEFKSRHLVGRGNNHIHSFETMKRPPQSWCYVAELEK